MWKFLAIFIVFQQLACQSDQEFFHEYSMGKMHDSVSESAKKKGTLKNCHTRQRKGTAAEQLFVW